MRERVGLVGCVSEKQSRGALAADLYTSTLFRGRRRWVERTTSRWFILSALHGLVRPDQHLEPYDFSLTEVGVRERRAWAAKVLDQLTRELGDLGRYHFEIHAGAAYRLDGLVAGLTRRGADIDVPLEGLGIGRQLAVYANQQVSDDMLPARREAAPASERPPQPRPPIASSAGPARGAYQALCEHLAATEAGRIRLTFREVERVLGRPLPASARKHRAWWSNSTSLSHATAWLGVGWQVSHVDFNAGYVTFDRGRPHG